jgi:NADH-quinone oxidoreductase subunit M
MAGFLSTRQQSSYLSAFGGFAKQVPLLATFLLIIGLALSVFREQMDSWANF